MYAHVTTYRLGTPDRSELELCRFRETDEPVSDQTAMTIASWWHSPASTCRNLTALSHGLPFDTTELAAEIAREVTDADDAAALNAWLGWLEVHLPD
jgi:hypothetical protein